MAEKKCESMEGKCAFCGGTIMYKPYAETIDGKKLKFHAKACADAFKEMKWPHCVFCGGIIAYEPYTETIGEKSPLPCQSLRRSL
jgi:hypothetical protein